MRKKEDIQSELISFFEKEDEFFNAYSKDYQTRQFHIINISKALEDFYILIENAYQNKYSFNYQKEEDTNSYFMNQIFYDSGDTKFSYIYSNPFFYTSSTLEYSASHEAFFRKSGNFHLKIKDSGITFDNIVEKFIKQSVHNFIKDNTHIFEKISYNMYLIDNIVNPLCKSGLVLSELFTTNTYYSLKEITKKLEEASEILSLTSDISVEKELNNLKERQETSYEKIMKKIKNIIKK